jgi:glycosyltransferase involved in cell wall biosynthesis
MHWLIVEDALRDRKGHWFEYVSTFARELRSLGDDVTILADRAAEPFLLEQFQAKPILPASIWHRMSDGASAIRRYARVPVHAWHTYHAVKTYLSHEREFDAIFVPTVLVHHLLGWTFLIKRVLKNSPSRVLLFFPNMPIRLDLKSFEPSWQPSPTAKLLCWLIRSLAKEVECGRLILGSETHPMRDSLTKLTGVPFTYFPHPVASQSANSEIPNHNPILLTFGSYGSARHEKGCDIEVGAVEEFCRRYPDSRVQFVLQSVEGNQALWRRLHGNPKVRLIPDYFADGEYAHQLQMTDILMLPYRRSSYALRVSRVMLEAIVNGMPVIATRGTTLADQADKFGAAVLCEDDNVSSLVHAIYELERNFPSLKARAEERKISARQHFSVHEFRQVFSRAQSLA